MRALIRSGLLTPTMAWNGLNQTRGVPAPGDLPSLGAGTVRAPRAAFGMVPAIAKGTAAAVLAGRHPGEPDERALARWDRRMAALVGH